MGQVAKRNILSKSAAARAAIRQSSPRRQDRASKRTDRGIPSNQPTIDTGTRSRATAIDAGLRFVSDTDAGLTRVKHGKLFRYIDRDGKVVRDASTANRIRLLAIPPAWTDVWICRFPNGHIQATGRDARGRKQYRYHSEWQRARDEAKFDRLIAFGRALPKLRSKINRHMSRSGLGRTKVLATVTHLLEATLIRVGNREYARTNNSFGLTTLEDRHVSITGAKVFFRFKGKTGKEWRLEHSHARVARIVRRCQELPGQHLFQYEDDDGETREVTSQDVNDYLREITGMEVTAKDFRTWAGTVLAAMALAEFAKVDTKAAAKSNIRDAVGSVAARLGNTSTICRKCYIHPDVLTSYLEGSLRQTLSRKVGVELRRDLSRLPPAEAATLAFLHARLTKR